MFTDEEAQEMQEKIKKWFARHGFDYDNFSKRRWSIHRQNGNVTLDQYRCRLLHRYGQIITTKTLIYLDLKFWINLRKVVLGNQQITEYAQIYFLLKSAVEAGTAVCPLSFWIFEELIKQTDLNTRMATVRLIDELSSGVAFMAHGQIVRQEVLHFIRKVTPQPENIKNWPIHECIWTRTASFLGDKLPVWPITTFQASDQLLIQKNIEDLNFFMPLEEFLSDLGIIPESDLYKGYNVDDINQRKAAVRKQHASFKSLFLAELMHTIKENEEHWFEAMSYLHYLESGIDDAIDANKLTEIQKLPARNLIWYGFEKNKITDELPSYHIPAGLYAAASWDTNRHLTDNDVLDFHHAQLAIPYCDVFMTEVGLRTLVTGGNLRLDKIYNTIVIADPQEALGYLQDKWANLTERRSPILQELFQQDTYARFA